MKPDRLVKGLVGIGVPLEAPGGYSSASRWSPLPRKETVDERRGPEPDVGVE
jgi:hypothetical protein